MASPGNEPEFNHGTPQSLHQQGQSRHAPSLDTDLLSDPSHLISLIISGSDGHGMSSTRRRERERVYAHLPQEELLNMLIDKEYEAKRLLKVLRASVQRLNAQYTRMSELERDNQEALDRLRQINQSRIEAQQDASRANQELELYRIQFQNAQQDLTRAWNAVQILQQQRDEAETAAARARAKARRFRQQRLVDAARAEGRRWGFHDGFERAKQAFAVTMTSSLPVNDSFRTGDDQRAQEVEAEEPEDDADSTRSSSPEIIQPTEVRMPSGHSESPAIQNPFGGFPPSHPSTSHPPPPSQQPLEPVPDPDPLAPPTMQPENVLPVAQQNAPSGSNRPPDIGDQTPAISVFQVDFADAQQELGSRYSNQNQHPSNTPKNSWVTAQQHQAQHSQTPMRHNDDPRYGPRPDQAGPSHPHIPQRPPPSATDEKKKASWYRSFSFRNKFGKRRVIDPDPVQEATTANTADVEIDPDEEEIYRQEREPSVSWYQPSTRASRHRAGSVGSASTSTHVSQLPLVNTPLLSHDINTSTGSLSIKSGKGTSKIKKIKEKESFLSVINEDPMSREHTPTTDGFAINRSRTPDIHHFARGPSGSRFPQFASTSGADSSSGRHRRTMSDFTSPVTIIVQTPSHSRTSSDPRHNEELPNRFLSPSIASQPLPRSPKLQARSVSPQTARVHSPSHQTPAMNVRENYLARAESHSGSAGMWTSHGPARPASRQSNHSGAVTGKNSGLPSSPNMNGQGLPRVPSDVSLRSQGPYDRFDLTKYRDPADYAPNAEPSRYAPTRSASRNSGLSDAYIDEGP